eukprot:1020512-Amphidinium_carterae.1
MAPHTSGASVPMSSTTGVPQGNPVSTVLFCLVLHDAIQRTRTAVPHYFKVWAYADDVTLTAAPAHIDAVMAAFQTSLHHAGLALNLDKTAVWVPDGSPLPEASTLAQ